MGIMKYKNVGKKTIESEETVNLHPCSAWPWPHRAGQDYQDSHIALAGIFDAKKLLGQRCALFFWYFYVLN